jgi:predicted dehydrogenase
MKMGIHVLCEKPLALSISEVDAMSSTSQKTGMRLAEAFMYRHHPQTKKAGELVRARKLGSISMVRGAFDFAFESRQNIRLVPEWGGGCLWDVGVYPISFAQFIMGGPPVWVTGAQYLGETGVDEIFIGQMGYPGSRYSQISAAFRTPFHTFFEIIGTLGRLHISMPYVGLNQGEMRLFPKNGESELITVPEKNLYLGEIEDMHASILDNMPNYLSLSESRNHIKTVLALYKSARTLEIVNMD